MLVSDFLVALVNRVSVDLHFIGSITHRARRVSGRAVISSDFFSSRSGERLLPVVSDTDQLQDQQRDPARGIQNSSRSDPIFPAVPDLSCRAGI